MDANRVRVLEDGTSSSDASDIGPDHGVPIDPLSARSIEVVRGAATLRYGSQAIGGVVNAINNRVPPTPARRPRGSQRRIRLGVQCRTVSTLGDIAVGNFAIHADGFYRGTGSYDTPLGLQPNSFFRGDGVSLGSSYFFGDKSRIGGAVIHYDSNMACPATRPSSTCGRPNIFWAPRWTWAKARCQTLNIIGVRDDVIRMKKKTRTIPSIPPSRTKSSMSVSKRLLGAMRPPIAAAVGIEVQNRQFQALGEGADYLLPTLTQNYRRLPVRGSAA